MLERSGGLSRLLPQSDEEIGAPLRVVDGADLAAVGDTSVERERRAARDRGRRAAAAAAGGCHFL